MTLEACDGQRTIARAKPLFHYIDSDFKNWNTDVAGEAAPAMPVAVYETVKDANLAKMFGALADDPSRLALTQDQIIQFVERHRNWLRQDGWATFFLFRSGDSSLSLACFALLSATSGCTSTGLSTLLCGLLTISTVWLSRNCNPLNLIRPQAV